MANFYASFRNMDKMYSDIYGNPDDMLARALKTMGPDGVLNISYIGLRSLPPLPPTVKKIFCQGNPLESMEKLPPSLVGLYCDRTPSLRRIGTLPPTLEALHCNISGLEALPDLPYGLQELFCDSTHIRTLPELPPMLAAFSCRDNLYLEEPFRSFVQMYENDYAAVDYDLRDLKRDVNEYHAKRRQQQRGRELEENLVAKKYSPEKVEKMIEKLYPQGMTSGPNNWEGNYIRMGEVWTEGVGKKGGKRKTQRRKSKKRKTQKRKH
jgi:hypothetical protein